MNKPKRKIRAKLPYPLNIQNPAELFDLICFKNWMMGNMDSNAPIEQSRKAYKEIKRLILYYGPDKN